MEDDLSPEATLTEYAAIDGYNAFLFGEKASANPFPVSSETHKEWKRGFEQAEQEQRQRLFA